MASDFPDGHERGVKMENASVAQMQEEPNPEWTVFKVERSGEWMPVEELMASALKALREGMNITLDLDKIEHLDASALQVLLALDLEQKRRGRYLDLTNASAHLRLWFGYSGSADQFFMERKHGE